MLALLFREPISSETAKRYHSQTPSRHTRPRCGLRDDSGRCGRRLAVKARVSEVNYSLPPASTMLRVSLQVRRPCMRRSFSLSAPSYKERLVILGSGWGGYEVLRRVDKKRWGACLAHNGLPSNLRGHKMSLLSLQQTFSTLRRCWRDVLLVRWNFDAPLNQLVYRSCMVDIILIIVSAGSPVLSSSGAHKDSLYHLDISDCSCRRRTKHGATR